MEYTQVQSLPTPCQDCQEEECYACDYAGQRWSLGKRKALLLRRKGLLAAIRRMERQIEQIDNELSNIP